MFSSSSLLAVAALLSLGRANVVITYPGWRGNNLITNGTVPQNNPNSLGIDFTPNGSATFPFEMQSIYPCGGMPVTTNRSSWPTTGGAISIQPGIDDGFKTSLIYFNLGVTEPGQLAPANYSNLMMGPVEIAGPNASTYAGQFCFPQVPMPAGFNLKAGTNATIQVVQIAATGQAMYSCSDVVLETPGSSSIANINAQNCYNSSDLTLNLVFTTASLVSGATQAVPASSGLAALFAAAVVSAAFALL